MLSPSTRRVPREQGGYVHSANINPTSLLERAQPPARIAQPSPGDDPRAGKAAVGDPADPTQASEVRVAVGDDGNVSPSPSHQPPPSLGEFIGLSR